MSKEASIVPLERVEQAIYLIRGQKVMLDRDLAALYDVETKAMNQAVKRNAKRFPSDFMFELTREEIMRMSQIVTSSERPDIKYLKRVSVFTEQGVAMGRGCSKFRFEFANAPYSNWRLRNRISHYGSFKGEV